MATTFLEYLTLPNPPLDTRGCKKGSTTKSRIGYGPDFAIEWKDVTWHSLKATFGNVLMQSMKKPKILNAGDIPEEKREISEESGMTTLAQKWNEQVVEHALHGTQEKLRVEYPKTPFCRGNLHFEKNDSRGNLQDEDRRTHKPDWLTFQKQGSHNYKLVFGDTKTARKFKSRNINDPLLQRESYYPLEQITKYMWLGKTRYGFILTDEELVLVRLSFLRKEIMNTEPYPQKKNQMRMLNNSMDVGLVGPDPHEAIVDFRSQAHARSFDSYSGSQTPYYTLLEWTSIPWSNYGSGKLTVNLGLWWWSMLAVQSCSIKEGLKYTALGERKRGHSPEFDVREQTVKQPEALQNEAERSAGKRQQDKPQTPEQGVRRSKRRRRTPDYIESDSPPSHRRRTSTNKSSFTMCNSLDNMATSSLSTQIETSPSSSKAPSFDNSFLRRSRHSRQRASSRASSQITTAQNSQATEPLYASFRSIDSQA